MLIIKYYGAISLETLFFKPILGSVVNIIPKSSGMSIHFANMPCNHGCIGEGPMTTMYSLNK